jgi:hypothetical protein
MENPPIGATWLKSQYGLNLYHLTHESYMGTRLKKETDVNGNVTETYPPNYDPGDGPLNHIGFLLKYDDINLDFLKTVFTHIDPHQIEDHINNKPRGAYERRIGYLFEFLTGKKINLPEQIKGNYIDLLDNEKYVTTTSSKIQKWLINDNLLGTPEFCPIIRKTIPLQNVLQEDYKKLVEEVTRSFPAEIFHRAVNYLYTKETRSSYQIEHEKPTPERINRFITLLEKAGELTIKNLLSEEELTKMQNEIVDPRFAATGFRDFQNYIGQTMVNYKQLIHYVCPPPVIVNSLMNGLLGSGLKTGGIPAVVRSTIMAFGFVFIHPFEDGNGRLHRFFIHDMLTRGNIVSKGMIIPVSAHMVNHIKEYDSILENYSKPLLERLRYHLDDEDQLTIINPEEVESYFRYPDLTTQCVYLGNTIKGTITEDIFWEMEFLVKYDETKSAFRNIVDMPDKQIDLLIKFMHQNRGTFPARKRTKFSVLTDDELNKMQTAFREIFNIPAFPGTE